MSAPSGQLVALAGGAERARAAAFEAVYRAHFARVYRWIRRLAPSADPEDLCQDVFVVVHRQLERFEGRAALDTWLFQITYRTVGAYIRRERTRRLALALFRRAAPEAPRAERDPAERSEAARALVAALESLSLDHRTVLVLFELEQWTCEDIALTLCVPLDTVYSRLHYARKKLARIAALREVLP